MVDCVFVAVWFVGCGFGALFLLALLRCETIKKSAQEAKQPIHKKNCTKCIMVYKHKAQEAKRQIYHSLGTQSGTRSKAPACTRAPASHPFKTARLAFEYTICNDTIAKRTRLRQIWARGIAESYNKAKFKTLENRAKHGHDEMSCLRF